MDNKKIEIASAQDMLQAIYEYGMDNIFAKTNIKTIFYPGGMILPVTYADHRRVDINHNLVIICADFKKKTSLKFTHFDFFVRSEND